MRAMVLEQIGHPLRLRELAEPEPKVDEILIEIEACAVCRTDLHVVDGDLPKPKLPLVLGHEIVGRILRLGSEIRNFNIGQRVGVPWLAHTCGCCPYCKSHHENLCDRPLFTGYTRDGGFAARTTAEASYVFDLSGFADPISAAPLMCAGLIGWRSLIAAGDGADIGIYGFGAAAHILAQVCRWQGRKVFAFTRPGDEQGKRFARSLGVTWAGGSDESPPAPLDAAIIFAPVGALVPAALKHVKKRGRVVCGGIHMSDIPSFPYRDLWEERSIVSVANLTREDGDSFMALAKQAGIRAVTQTFSLEQTNEALDALRQGRLTGTAVIVP